jgi:hypothetical protein
VRIVSGSAPAASAAISVFVWFFHWRFLNSEILNAGLRASGFLMSWRGEALVASFWCSSAVLSRGKKKADLSKIIAAKRQVEHTPEKGGQNRRGKGWREGISGGRGEKTTAGGLIF